MLVGDLVTRRSHTYVARSIGVECAKDVFTEFLRFARGIELFVDFNELLLVESSTWTVFLSR